MTVELEAAEHLVGLSGEPSSVPDAPAKGSRALGGTRLGTAADRVMRAARPASRRAPAGSRARRRAVPTEPRAVRRSAAEVAGGTQPGVSVHAPGAVATPAGTAVGAGMPSCPRRGAGATTVTGAGAVGSCDGAIRGAGTVDSTFASTWSAATPSASAS